jgi:hypothetical protein
MLISLKMASRHSNGALNSLLFLKKLAKALKIWARLVLGNFSP